MSIESTRPFLRDLSLRRSRVERFLVAAHELPGMTHDERIDVIEDVIAFLTETMLPHADAELFMHAPATGRFGRSAGAASIAFDCEEIRARIAELADTDPSRTGRLQELLYALHVLCANHVQKEEEAYLRLLLEDPDTMERLVDDIEAYEHTHSGVSLDHV